MFRLKTLSFVNVKKILTVLINESNIYLWSKVCPFAQTRDSSHLNDFNALNIGVILFPILKLQSLQPITLTN
jgi:hypothetical protein